MTSHPYGNFDPAGYQVYLSTAIDGVCSFLDLLAPEVPLPTCPGWTVRSVGDHLGDLHAWVTRIVSEGRPPADWIDLTAGDEPLESWYAAKAHVLLATLAATDPDRRCWTHQPDRQVAGYWSRRMAHEVMMHRVDLAVAAQQPPEYPGDLAVDGICEVFDVWQPLLHRAGVAVELGGAVLLECADRPERWLIAPAGKGGGLAVQGPMLADAMAGQAAAVIRGKSIDVLLRLWKRRDSGVESMGDHAAAGRFLGSTITP